MRKDVVTGKVELSQEFMQEFDKQAAENMDTQEYKDLTVLPVDTKDIANSQGIPDFWLKALLAFPPFRAMIKERDRYALSYLTNIRHECA
jgi:hypothetical protein